MTATPVQLDDAKAVGRDASSEMVIKCVGLSKVFRDFWMRQRVKAVENIDLEVRRGEVFGLLGPNGSGKSTTIKMILGLLRPTSGRIALFGKRPDDVATKKLVGYLPEESYLYRFLNARETLDYYGRLFHQSRAQRNRRIDMLLEMVGLDSAQRRPVGEYSKGMQRRIGLAQALINDPALLILDEPTTGLDPIGTRQIKDLIVTLAGRGKTILLCSHLLADVEDVCQRVAIMFGGKVRALGTVDELLTRSDMTTLQTPVLDVQEIQEIEQVLARHGKSIDKVERPRQKLEALFLDIVKQAQAEGLATSGAKASSRIADFLSEGSTATAPAAVEGKALIERLVEPTVKEETKLAREAAASMSAPTPTAASAASSDVLSKLLAKEEPVAPAPLPGDTPTPVTEAEPPPDLSVVQNLVSGTTTWEARDERPKQEKAADEDDDGVEKPFDAFKDAVEKVRKKDEGEGQK